MNKNKTDWTDKLRSRLDDYQVAADDDLWAGIEQSLVRPHSHPKHALVVGWRRWSMAAALAALVAGGSYVYLRQPAGSSSQPYAHTIPVGQLPSSKALHGQPAIPSRHTSPNMGGTQASGALLAYGPSAQDAHVGHRNEEKPRSMAPTAAEPMLAVASTEPQADDKPARSVESLTSTDEDGYTVRRQAQQPAYTHESSTYAEGTSLMASATHDGHSDWSVKLYAENGFIGRMSDTDKVFSQDGMMDAPSYNDAYQGLGINGGNTLYSIYRRENRTKAKHHFPLSVGLQVGIPLMPRLKLNTGLVYTRVSSDFTQDTNDNPTNTRQTLHYVGIPLGITYEVWAIGRLNTYVNVGAEADVNVENDTQVNDKAISVGKDRMQWSGNASVGIQYDVIPQLGIYAEPGAKYYFDNGSDIDNTFKDQKLNFNFQFGLRWNIK